MLIKKYRKSNKCFFKNLALILNKDRLDNLFNFLIIINEIFDLPNKINLKLEKKFIFFYYSNL